MHLVFAYIEKFRNIERQQYFFDKSYEVDLLEKEKSKYKIEISKKKEHFNITKKNNVENITVVVGKNGAGKTAWIIAMSELLEAFDESAFIFFMRMVTIFILNIIKFGLWIYRVSIMDGMIVKHQFVR